MLEKPPLGPALSLLLNKKSIQSTFVKECIQGCMQKFLLGEEGGGEFISLYYGLTQHFILCAEGPSTTDLP